ncbi:hypothetical protein EIN_409800 [Entamoeba invadens IP1]|uniref:Uncharacterized protein n=1 Tax=Entamoeba invadens IP1 TaxID=370355 RepID=A0A0A1TWT6_ENTIV|nr:hypothetical protein EIN_409800 [Entamoeba invadens IP1]ELP85661.1 hypothetical protein EIN_409800 [Entamoeba invadens IP1]|eukprot:XP_004185007.1 hypothetical protein EIN_409800 [Entamoeba invadens IP1]
MQPTIFRPVTLPSFQPFKTFFPLVTTVNISDDSFVEDSIKHKKKRSTSVGDECQSSLYAPKRAESVGVSQRQKLTKGNLNAAGLGYISSDDKKERVFYWIDTIKETDVYPHPSTL